MSEPQNPYGQSEGSPPTNPYGAPNPYGQSEGSPPTNPYGAPNPYGSPAPTGQPYGQPYGQPGGQPPYGASYSTRDPDKRPGTVTAASTVTMIFSGITLLLFAGLTLAMVVARDEVMDEIDAELSQQSGMEDLTSGDLATFLTVLFAILALWCLAAIVFAILALRRKGWARVVTVVSAAVAALFSLLGITSLVSGITLIAAVAVIVLFFTGGANDWYSRRSGPQASPGPPGYQ